MSTRKFKVEDSSRNEIWYPDKLYRISNGVKKVSIYTENKSAAYKIKRLLNADALKKVKSDVCDYCGQQHEKGFKHEFHRECRRIVEHCECKVV